MLEDFGWSGDEFLLGDCMDDWTMDILDLRAEEYAERRRMMEADQQEHARLLEEDEVDDYWDRLNDEGDRCAADYGDMDCYEDEDDYLNCDWEE